MTAGDRVAYSVAFRRSIEAHTGKIPHARGRVLAAYQTGRDSLIAVRWADGTQGLVLENHLAKVDTRGMYAL